MTFGLDRACFAALFEIAFDRGQRDPKQTHDLVTGCTLVHSMQYMFS